MSGQRYDWSEANTLVNRILPVISKYFTQVVACGSYRRNAPTVSDLDIVCLGPKEDAPAYQPNHPKYLYRKLGVQETPFDALLVELEVPAHQVSRRNPHQVLFNLNPFKVDLVLATVENYGALILFTTGSVAFNRGMRAFSSNKGLVLTREGLFDQQKQRLAGSTEQGIFTYLDLAYVEPQNRAEFPA